MNATAVLAYVKACMNITGTYHDALLNNYIQEVAGYMQDAEILSQQIIQTSSH